MKDCTYTKTRGLKQGDEVISEGIRRTVTFTMHVEGRTGWGMGDGPDHMYVVLDNGQVWSFGSWAEVSKGRLVSIKTKTPSSF